MPTRPGRRRCGARRGPPTARCRGRARRSAARRGSRPWWRGRTAGHRGGPRRMVRSSGRCRRRTPAATSGSPTQSARSSRSMATGSESGSTNVPLGRRSTCGRTAIDHPMLPMTAPAAMSGRCTAATRDQCAVGAEVEVAVRVERHQVDDPLDHDRDEPQLHRRPRQGRARAAVEADRGVSTPPPPDGRSMSPR